VGGVLRWAAVLGQEFSVTDLEVVTGRTAGDLVGVVDTAAAAGVIAEAGPRLGFRHGLIRQVRTCHTSSPSWARGPGPGSSASRFTIRQVVSGPAPEGSSGGSAPFRVFRGTAFIVTPVTGPFRADCCLG